MADTLIEPLVTVGICCYNREQGLKNTLAYITEQTYKNIEIIVSQDYNPTMDFTPLISDVNDSRITYYRQPQRLSMYGNFKFLLEKAQGQYFMWAADDDWWAPGFIEEIMKLLLADPSAALGFCDFMEVDEDGSRIMGYPDHLPLLEEFTSANDVTRIKNYINQFEALGKANLFYAIFKIDVLRTQTVLDLLTEGDLPCDMLINLSGIMKGRLALVPQVLRTCTAGNIKDYNQLKYEPKRINLGLVYFDMNTWNYLYKKWHRFIVSHFKVLKQSDLAPGKRIRLYPVLIKKILMFYYDLFCDCGYVRAYNFLGKIRRKQTLN